MESTGAAGFEIKIPALAKNANRERAALDSSGGPEGQARVGRGGENGLLPSPSGGGLRYCGLEQFEWVARKNLRTGDDTDCCYDCFE